MNHTIPKDGIAGLQHWRNDLIASFSVLLVALPLGLGIAYASKVPPMAGVISVIVAGIVTTFVRGSHVAINGPAAGLITATLIAMETLGGFEYVLAAFVVTGIIQMIFGLLKLGKIGNFFPSSVIHGMLAAIGIIIFAKQAHVALGKTVEADSYIDLLLQIPNSILDLNPFVATISILSLIILIIHPHIKNKLVHFLPAPLFVLMVAIPLVYIFNFFEPHTVMFFSKAYEITPDFLVNVPGNLLDSIAHPNFDKIGEIDFWIAVVSFTLVASIETLLSTPAIDKLDPFRRKTNLNRDFFGIGFSTFISGLIGGLPIITVIVRSSVNINNGAKTRWANFYHGAILLVLVYLYSPYLNQIPLGALAAILVFTGYKLASPKVFKDTYQKGPEQFIILIATVFITLKIGLLQGIFAGVTINLLIHLISLNMPLKIFLSNIFKPSIEVLEEKPKQYHVVLRGIANFFNVLHLTKKLESIPKGESIDIDFTHTNLADLTTLTYVSDFVEEYQQSGGIVHVIGLDFHKSSSDYPHSLRIHVPPNKIYAPTKRQCKLEQLCKNHKWELDAKLKWDCARLSNFHFFDIRPIEHSNNTIRGSYKDLNIDWQVCDITFDEGALLGRQVYRTTIQIMKLPKTLPIFSLEQEEFFDRFLGLTGYEEVDFKIFTDISKKFVIKGIDSEAIHNFFTPEIVNFFESQEIYHLESNGESLLVFKYLRLANSKNIEEMVLYSDRFIHLIS